MHPCMCATMCWMTVQECVAVTVRVSVCSVYVQPSQPWDFLDQLVSLCTVRYFLCGDLNAHRSACGDGQTNSCGEHLWDAMLRINVTEMNTGGCNFRHGRCTAIDLSLVSAGVEATWKK